MRKNKNNISYLVGSYGLLTSQTLCTRFGFCFDNFLDVLNSNLLFFKLERERSEEGEIRQQV